MQKFVKHISKIAFTYMLLKREGSSFNKTYKTMKRIKVLVMAVAVLATTGAFAQKGLWFEGGLGYNHSEEENFLKENTFNVNAGVNYMLDRNWSVGLNLGFEMTDYDLDNKLTQDYKENMFNITPQAIYTTKLIGGLSWTPRLYFTYGMGKHTIRTALGDNDYDLTKIECGVDLLAVEFHVDSHVALGAKLNAGTLYFRSMDYDNLNAKETEFNLPLGSWNNSGVTLSFHYYL